MARAAKKREAHPEEELRSLQNSLKDGLGKAYVLRGEERFFRDRAVELVVQAAQAAGQELCRHDATDPEFSPARLLDDLSGSSLFSSARCIVLHDAPKVINPAGKVYVEAAAPALMARLASDEEGCIVLVGDSLPATGKVVKAAQKAGATLCSMRKLWDTPPPWDPDPRKAEVVQWLAGRARARKIQLSLDEAAYVVAATGGDLYALDGELDRLLERGGGQRVHEIVSWRAGASPWNVAEAIVTGDAARGMAGIESLFQGGFQGRDGTRTLDAGGLVTMLISALTGKARESLAGARALDEGADSAGARAAAGVRGGVQATRSFDARTSQRSVAEWSRFLAEVGELERGSRTGAAVDVNDLALLTLRWRSRKTRARR